MSSTGITLTDARKLLEATLDSAGLPVMPHAGALQAAPGCMVAAGDPWLVPVPSLARLERLSRWRVLLVAGQADAEGILDQLGTMIAQVLQALPAAGINIDGRQSVGAPRRLGRENALYLTVELTAMIVVSLATMPAPSGDTQED